MKCRHCPHDIEICTMSHKPWDLCRGWRHVEGSHTCDLDTGIADYYEMAEPQPALPRAPRPPTDRLPLPPNWRACGQMIPAERVMVAVDWPARGHATGETLPHVLVPLAPTYCELVCPFRGLVKIEHTGPDVDEWTCPVCGALHQEHEPTLADHLA